MTETIDQNKVSPHRRMMTKLIIIGIAMFGFGYLLVPFYNVFCKALGINGKPNSVSIVNDSVIDKTRTVRVEFIATNNESLQWIFRPMETRITLHPGEDRRIAYFAQNLSDHDMVIQAIPSITPGIAAKHFKKTECFCFTQQYFKAHESMEMQVLFHLDPALPKKVKTITLSYTVFDVTEIAKKHGQFSHEKFN